MPTKYILYGGHAKDKTNTDAFFQEMARNISKKDITIVYIPFGKKQKEDQEKWYTINKASCVAALPNKTVTFLVAQEHPQEFLDQLHGADVIYFGGGNDEMLKAFLSHMPLDILKNILKER